MLWKEWITLFYIFYTYISVDDFLIVNQKKKKSCMKEQRIRINLNICIWNAIVKYFIRIFHRNFSSSKSKTEKAKQSSEKELK